MVVHSGHVTVHRCDEDLVWKFLPSHVSRQEELSLKSDKSPLVCFIEKHKQHFIDILLFMEATKMKK